MSTEDFTIADQNAVYFLTFTINDWVDIFTRSCYRMVVVDSLNYYIESKGLSLPIKENFKNRRETHTYKKLGIYYRNK